MNPDLDQDLPHCAIQQSQRDLRTFLQIESDKARIRKEFFSRLSDKQQVNLIIAATARSSTLGSIEESLNEMLDVVLALRA
jgi:hypothetical protein